jgi:hypothetical protein
MSAVPGRTTFVWIIWAAPAVVTADASPPVSDANPNTATAVVYRVERRGGADESVRSGDAEVTSI